jgi:hypothetical protein
LLYALVTRFVIGLRSLAIEDELAAATIYTHHTLAGASGARFDQSVVFCQSKKLIMSRSANSNNAFPPLKVEGLPITGHLGQVARVAPSMPFTAAC